MLDFSDAGPDLRRMQPARHFERGPHTPPPEHLREPQPRAVSNGVNDTRSQRHTEERLRYGNRKRRSAYSGSSCKGIYPPISPCAADVASQACHARDVALGCQVYPALHEKELP